MTDPSPSDAPPLGPLIRAPQRPRALWVQVLLVAAATLCFAAGVVGWLVPVITGIPFYVLGFVCLAKVSPWMAERVNALDARLPDGARRALRWRPRWLRPDDDVDADAAADDDAADADAAVDDHART